MLRLDSQLRATIADSPEATPVTGLDTNWQYRLSRYVQIRPEGSGYVAESLISGHREPLPNPAAVRLLLSLTTPVRLGSLLTRLGTERSARATAFFRRCLEGALITRIGDDGTADEDAIGSLAHWELHDLAFHLRSRRGRNTAPTGATWGLASIVPPEPARRPIRKNVLATLPLPRPDLARLREQDWPLTRALECRRSRYSTLPVSLTALGELLFRACRVTGSAGQGTHSGELIRKVHPSGGSLHSLELYVLAHRCTGLERGGYWYDPFEHHLVWLRKEDADVTELLREAKSATLKLPDLPSVLLIFASRFRRVTRKYQSLAYRALLQEVGTVYQTLYLVAQTLDLAVSAIGSGDSERFARAFETDFFAESSVGELIVGGTQRT